MAANGIMNSNAIKRGAGTRRMGARVPGMRSCAALLRLACKRAWNVQLLTLMTFRCVSGSSSTIDRSVLLAGEVLTRHLPHIQ
jgi:hypothetical protein